MRDIVGAESTEWIKDGDEELALIIRHDFHPSETVFLTPDDYKQQLGFIVYGADTEIPRHDHKPLERTIKGTSEFLMIKEGKVEVTFYSSSREEVCRRTLSRGDMLLIVGGGHGFKQLEDTIYLEIKQGPYPGVQEKDRF